VFKRSFKGLAATAVATYNLPFYFHPESADVLMPDPRIQLKLPWLAGLLAFLLPGAGHLYQGRYFKAVVYFCCILGLFLTGMAMAEWQAVQPPPRGAFKQREGTAILKYAAQAAVGVPALYGLVQRERYDSKENIRVTSINSPMKAAFEGTAIFQDDAGTHDGPISGTITLEPAEEQFGKGSITGQLVGTMDGQPITLQLSKHVELAPPVNARKQRTVVAGIVRELNGRMQDVGQLRGSIPRGFWNWFEVPMEDHEQQELHRRLGKYHELAMVFTWIAGLLNVLAIWDAVEGPAYGYGDEQPSADASTAPA
jgi:hypothetical protein